MPRRHADDVHEVLAAGHELLRDDAAVFGLSYAAEAAPAWVEDDGEVGRRICAKAPDALGADLWWRVADIARICRMLSRCSGHQHSDDLRHVEDGLRTSLSVADDLPWPLPATCTRPDPLDEPVSVIAAAGPRRDLLDVAGHRLAAALDDPQWVDPDALAGWVDDAVLALRAYGSGLLAVGV
jgi:hypothetical protein